MQYVTIPITDSTSSTDMTSIAWVTKSGLFLDRRYHRYEFRTTKSLYKKYKLVYDAIAQINKTEVFAWNDTKSKYSEKIYTKLK